MIANKSVFLASILAFFALSGIVCEAEYPEDSVVKIFLTTTQGKGASGTGSIVSNDGLVLTCYHVIKDAKKITIILSNKQLYSDVTIVRISPAYDLAVLKVKSLPPLKPVLLAKIGEPGTYSLPLDTYAFPSKTGISGGVHLPAEVAKTTWLPSRELRDSEGRALFDFRKPSINLIAITMVIDNGDSGAPLLSRTGIVGLISGSFQEGGSISWAIPLDYYQNASNFLPINETPRAMQTWPAMEPMSTAWRPLRSEVSLTLPLTVALDKYAATLDQLRTVCSEQVRNVPVIKSVLQGDVRKADALIADGQSDTPVLPFGKLWQGFAEDQIVDTLEGFGKCRDTYVQIRADGKVLNDQVLEYYGKIEHSRINEHLLEITRARVKRIDELTRKLDPDTEGDWSQYVLSPLSSVKDYRAAFQKGIEVIDRTNPQSGVSALISAFTGFDEILEALLQSQPQRHPKAANP